MTATFGRALLGAASAIAIAAGASGAMAQTTTLVSGGSTLAGPTYGVLYGLFQTANPSYVFAPYAEVGSGGGQAGFLNNDCTFGGRVTCSTPVPVDIGASDSVLAAASVTAYNTTGLSVQDGPLIQLPTFGTPITIPFKNSKITSGSKLVLTDDQLCGIFSGKLTDWSQVDAKAAPGTITVVYRAEGSGTSYLTTQHLSFVCNSSNSSITFTPQLLFASEFPNSTPPANFIAETGSGGVQAELLSLSSAIGYLSPDYTSIAPGSTNHSSLIVASVMNAANGIAYQPTVKNTELALKSPGKNATNGTPPNTAANAADPNQWVPQLPTPSAGYPIVGYTTFEVSSCYADKNAGSGVVSFLSNMYKNSSYKTRINTNGFATLVNGGLTNFVTSINNDFLTNKSGYNLNIDGKECKTKVGR